MLRRKKPFSADLEARRESSERVRTRTRADRGRTDNDPRGTDCPASSVLDLPTLTCPDAPIRRQTAVSRRRTGTHKADRAGTRDPSHYDAGGPGTTKPTA